MKVANLSALCTSQFYSPWDILVLLLETVSIQGHSVSGRIKPMKNPKDPIRNRTWRLMACSPVSQSTAPSCTPIIAYLLTYLLHGTVLLEKLTGSAASQETPRPLWNLKVHHRIHKCLPSVPILSQLHPVSNPSHFPKIHLNIILPSMWGSFSPCEYFLTGFFHGEVLLAPHPTPKLEDHPSSAVRDCLFDIFAAALHIGGCSSIRNLRTRRAMVTGTDLSLIAYSRPINVVLRTYILAIYTSLKFLSVLLICEIWTNHFICSLSTSLPIHHSQLFCCFQQLSSGPDLPP